LCTYRGLKHLTGEEASKSTDLFFVYL